ncbi:MAG TPA: patatin-like phospholipase family protein, partial [Bacteroidota bacterium]|nr:patatin-like phospholipase family protein [Bacteroidota bacterium]
MALPQDSAQVGLVLSGGGARGLAHIGVLKVLEEAGMPIDRVVGTSMGSVVGALVALGYHAAQIESIAVAQDWTNLISDPVFRSGLAMERKRTDGRYVTSLPIRGGTIALPAALVPGYYVSKLLSHLTLGLDTSSSFESLPIPFACLATDLSSGEPVVLDHGDLGDAVRASMAIPTIFDPIRINGRLLVDGGVVRNLPAEDARRLGAAFIIGVDVGPVTQVEEEYPSILQIISQTVFLVSNASREKERKLCNIVIDPDVKQYTVMDFSDVRAIIRRGEQAARAMLPRLRVVADSLRRLRARTPIRAMHPPDALRVDRLSLEGFTQPEEIIRRVLALPVPGQIAVRELDEALDRLYYTQFSTSLRYRAETKRDSTTVIISGIPRSEDRIRIGLRYDSDEHGAVLLNGSLGGIGAESGLLNADLKLGERILFDAWYTLPLGLIRGLGLRLDALYDKESLDLYGGGSPIGSLGIQSSSLSAFLGTIFTRSLSLGAGMHLEYTENTPQIARADLSSTNRLATMTGRIWLDTFDRTLFPHQGISLLANFDGDLEGLGGSGGFTRWFAKADVRLPILEEISLSGGGFLGLAHGTSLPAHYLFFLGGMNSAVTIQDQQMTRGSYAGLNARELAGTQAQNV